MKNAKIVAAVLGLLALSACASTDRYTVADSSRVDRVISYNNQPADPTPGAGAPGGMGAGAVRR